MFAYEPHKMKVAEIRKAIKALEAHEAEMLAKAERAPEHRLEAEYAAEAYEAMMEAGRLAAFLPYH